MDQVENAFSLLELDVPDDREQTATAVTADDKGTANGKGKGKKKSESSGNMAVSKNDNGGQRNDQRVLEEYKLPLVWIDLEMTGFREAV